MNKNAQDTVLINPDDQDHHRNNSTYNWFRCEPMTLCQLFLQTESAYQIVSILGSHGICQFRDLNQSVNAFQRKFVTEIRRCIAMEQKLAFFEKEIERENIEILPCAEHSITPSMKDIAKLETQIEKLENDLVDVNKNRSSLKKRLLRLTEFRHILKKTDQFFEEAQNFDSNTSKIMRRMSVVDPQLMRRFSIMTTNDVSIPLDPVVDIITLTGTILASRYVAFEKMLWRVSRGNILLKRIDIDEPLEDPETEELQQKCLFILVFQGEKLRTNCKKICDGFHTTLYQFPDKSDERKATHAQIVNEISETKMVIHESDEHRSKILTALAMNLHQWKISVIKVHSVFETMNMFSSDITEKCLIAECWIPTNCLLQARLALQQGQTLSNSSIPSALTTIETEQTPPTLNVTNKFTAGFQNIINSYGVSTYGEVNPAPFAIISFPFIFAVMFGDVGHGLLMALFAFWMIKQERSLESVRDEIFSMFFGGRYIIFLMGLFSIYTGFIYNDVFSKSVNFFGSPFDNNIKKLVTNCWEENNTYECWNQTTFTLRPEIHNNHQYRYPFGIDPIWQISSNKVLYLNAYKMKISVILGVMQMLFGVSLSFFNHWHFKKWISIAVEFIPQVIFLLAIFGYMDFMIFFKWFAFDSTNSSAAPSLLITLINMFMFKEPDSSSGSLYENQNIIQTILIIMALICVPVMLFIKPFYLNIKNRKKIPHQDETDLIELQKTNNGLKNEASTEHELSESFNLADEFINQTIHTIEYCLGSVSHTASYLRLWALSLAHAQLSEVLWNMVMAAGFMEFGHGPMTIVSSLMMFLVFIPWAVLTVAILIIMEGLSAFLHALRLHWVEFMSKFYHGTGYEFQPFSFKTIIKQLQ